MKRLKLYQVDAFANAIFRGNPAAVCPLEQWLSDDLMQSIASENNLSETAFFVRAGEHYEIRWFTPNTEVSLCGHATLASAFVIFNHLNHPAPYITFQSKSGELRVTQHNQTLQLDFPALSYKKTELPQAIIYHLGVTPQEVYQSEFDLLCIFEDEDAIKNAKPDLQALAKLNHRGFIFTSLSKKADIYSRCFYPGCDVPEDPVTGSAHCVIVPYWCHRLNKTTIHAIQGLKRQGELWCEIKNDRVLLSGLCHLYLEGTIHLGEEI